MEGRKVYPRGKRKKKKGTKRGSLTLEGPL